MKKITISLTVLGFFLVSCGNASDERILERNQTTTSQQLQHDDGSEVIELNNGQKWKVDANMLTHIRNMESDVISFAESDLKDFKSLSPKLQSNIELLTSNCTMKGKAHDELHKWLLPYIDMVEELSNAQDDTQAAKQFSKIQNSFITFNKYFQ